MRAAVLTDFGDVDRLELRDVPEPAPGRGELKVRVTASSLNPIDWKMRSGVYRQQASPPAILGRDATGEVTAVGEGVEGFRVGDKVLGLVNGAHAEYVVGKEDAWAQLPASLDAVDAAALPLAALTGAQLIDEVVNPRGGTVVLITGALGSVGRAAVFAARARGAEVVAGVRSRQREQAAQLDTDVVALDDDREIERLPRVDSIADTVGGKTLEKLIGKIRNGGVVASVLGEPTQAKKRGVNGRAHWTHPDPRRLAGLAQAAAAGRLVIPIAARMPLEEIREAHRRAQKGPGGKVVLRVH